MNLLQDAAEQNKLGLNHLIHWEIDRAIVAFQAASKAAPNNPEYHMNLAKAYARAGSYPEAMRSLGDYLHAETDEALADRYQQLFSSTLDTVEEKLIEGSASLEFPIQLTGRAMQMWLEYRLSVGRRELSIPDPRPWAAALIYAVCKVNFQKIGRARLATVFQISEELLDEPYHSLLETLDLIPADFRYFVGDDNPLDKIFEAAQLMNNIAKETDSKTDSNREEK